MICVIDDYVVVKWLSCKHVRTRIEIETTPALSFDIINILIHSELMNVTHHDALTHCKQIQQRPVDTSLSSRRDI